MIITKTPYRISFFGGGTDFEDYFKHHGGIVVGSTIDKYCYVTLKEASNFFNHKHRIIWSKIENVKKTDAITHPIVKSVIKYFKIQEGLEIHYHGELPGNSGVGSSSSFNIGLINAFNEKLKIKNNKSNNAKLAYHVEKNLCKEYVGLQDQVWASYGGFNKINFKKKKFDVKPVKISLNQTNNLEKNLLMFFTGKTRYGSDIEKDKQKQITKKLSYYNQIKLITKDAINILENNNENLKDFGYLLNEYWQLKKKLSKKVSNNKIDQIYSEGLKAGAIGGKLLGSGEGGFILFYCEKKFQKKIIKRLSKLNKINFKFSNEGAKVIFNDKK